MNDIWMQSRFGKALELVNPTVEQVDFAEICGTLADLNRFTGCAMPSVSVAFHSMIVADLVDEPLKPYALAHDMHESRIGDIATPVVAALVEIATDLNHDDYGARLVKATIKELKRRHDAVIWQAAGLPVPTETQLAAIKIADTRALLTERRDFLMTKPKPWNAAIEALTPSSRIYWYGYFGGTPDEVARTLLDQCKHYFPALPPAFPSTARFSAAYTSPP